MNKTSSTFHGRDIFAPVSTHLSLGINPLLLGEKIDDPVTIEIRAPLEENGDLMGEVIRVDNFGNLITNITREQLRPFLSSRGITITIGDLVLKKISNTYDDVPEGRALALIGSSDLLEIAINKGKASDSLGRKYEIGEKVIVKSS